MIVQLARPLRSTHRTDNMSPAWKKQLSDIGTQLVKIGDMLSNDAERVTVSQHHVQISNPNKFAIGSEWDTKEDVAREDLDPGKWHGLLEDLAKSQEIDGRLAKSLRTMNLADLIRERTA